MPLVCIMSNSATRNGGATLFLTTFARTRWPTTSSPSLSWPMRRTSMRQERVELQRPAAGRGFGTAEHHADLLADLVDEDHRGLALGDRAGQLAHRLAHQPGLQADVRIADLAFQFLLGHQRGDRVDDDHVDGVGLDQHLGDLHRLFAAARLADQQRFQFDAQLLGPAGVEGVLGVDERGDAARLLGLGHHVQGQRRLAARFRAEDLDDAAARNALAAQGDVQRQAAGGNARDRPALSAPRGMMAPSPNCFSICCSAVRRLTLSSKTDFILLVVVTASSEVSPFFTVFFDIVRLAST